MQLTVVLLVVAVMLELSQATAPRPKDRLPSTVSKRSTTPTKQCASDNEAEIVYNPANPLVIWICKNTTWTPFELLSSTGKTKELSAVNCQQIKEALPVSADTCAPESGVYWVKGMKIYCDMTIDGGGWTLVWKHTYMKYKTLNEKMFYYSDYNQPCVKNASYEEWCNVPNKARFNPTEQMIVAYHKGTIVYAYKGYFNCNIDRHWTGGILLDAKKVIDQCKRSSLNGVPPAPSIHHHSGIFGLTFDKASPTNHYLDCDTYHQGSTLTTPKDCRWLNCDLPSSISSRVHYTDMTIAIFVR
ncbi:uncharacterized protein [Dysidea avara]|uniref:uncharacterized protein n=1 Tax=Dysidea avara TaxID=196820 RepID=UPI0033290E71